VAYFHAGQEHPNYQLRHPPNTSRGKIPHGKFAWSTSQRKEAYPGPTKQQQHKKEEKLDMSLLQKKKKGKNQIRGQKLQNGQFTSGTRLTEQNGKDLKKSLFQFKKERFF